METRPFGKTGENFPILGFGGQRIVDERGCTEEEAIKILETRNEILATALKSIEEKQTQELSDDKVRYFKISIIRATPTPVKMEHV